MGMTATAQQPVPAIVGVVDVEKVLRESKAGKSIKAQYDKQRDAFKAEVNKQLKAFRDQEKKLLAQKDKLSPEEFNKKTADLNNQGKETEATLAQRERQLDENTSKAQATIFENLRVVTRDVAAARGMTLVVTKTAALVYSPSYEITAEVLKALDAKLPSVKLQ
jgi:Skp family chaperone for outer membrane proteins